MLNITDWIQAIGTLVALILSIITFYQGRKIKTITDIVEKLEQQINISRQILDFEIKNRMANIQPIFEINRIRNHEEGYRIMWLRNRGQKAKNVKCTAIQNVVRLEAKEEFILSEKHLEVTYTSKNSSEFSFDIVYEGLHGETFRQVIKGKDVTFNISWPELIL